MSESQVIGATHTPHTEKTLLRDLQRIGLQPSDTVLIHASLSRIGWVCGAETAVIGALLGLAADTGTLCMPAHSGENSDPAKWCNPPVPAAWNEIIYENMPAFDPAVTPTRGMGRIAELFRKIPGALRSDHPQVSFSAWGKNAAMITEGHRLTPQFGMDSPLGKLYACHAKVLLLGVGYDSCTCFHLAETLCTAMPREKTGTAMNADGVRKWVWFEDYAYDSDDFEELGRAFEQQGGVITGKIGNADCRLFELRAAVDFAEAWLKEHRFKKPDAT